MRTAAGSLVIFFFNLFIIKFNKKARRDRYIAWMENMYINFHDEKCRYKDLKFIMKLRDES